MKNKTLAAATFMFLVTLLLCAEAQAQVRVEFKLVPPGVLGVVGGTQYRLYTLEEWLELAEFDSELVKLRADIQDHKDIVNRFEKQVVEKNNQIKTLKKDKGILKRRSERLDNDLDQCEKDKLSATKDSILGYVVGAVGAAIGIVGATLWIAQSAENR